MFYIENQSAHNTEADAKAASTYKNRWDRNDRRPGCDLSVFKKQPKLTDLNNVERFILGLANHSGHTNAIKVAAASRWCSSVYTSLTDQQITQLIKACSSDENLDALLDNMLSYFDTVTGYVHVPPKKGDRKTTLSLGVFANINS